MLAQFQRLYPTGSLISELVQIYHGKYIVRSSVQIEGVTRATGMSAAETIEEAEDRSRTRALMVLAMQGESNVEAATIEQKQVEQIATSSQPNLQVLSNRSLTTAVTGNEYGNTTANPTEVTQTPVSNTPAASSQVTQTPVSNTPAVSSQVTQTEESPTPEVFSEDDNDFYSQDFDTPLPIPTYDEPEFEAPIEDNQPDDDEENQTEPSASNVTPINKSTAQTTKKTAKTSTTKRKKKTEPVDLSDVIAKTDVELERLGWTPQQGREYLINTYGKRGRTLLTEEELLDFLNYLESIPTQMNLSQTDPLAGF